METTDALRFLARTTVALAIAWNLLSIDYQQALAQRIHSLFFNPSKASLKKPPKHERKVSFGQLEILEFPCMLGDNPSVKCGAPLTLGWWPIRKSILSVDDVWSDDEDSFSRHVARRKPRPLLAKERELLLLSRGYNLLDIERASQRQEHHRYPPKDQLKPMQFSHLKTRLRAVLAQRRSRLAS